MRWLRQITVAPVASTTNPVSALLQSLRDYRGVSVSRAEQLERLGITTIWDLLHHFPRHYDDLSDVRKIAELSEGVVQTVEGEVVEMEGRELSSGKQLVSVVICDDGKNCLEGVWFNQPYAASRLRFGLRVAFSGRVKRFRGHWQMSSPRVRTLEGADQPEAPRIVPVYPLTGELRVDHLRSLIRRVLESHARFMIEQLPELLRQRHRFSPVQEAIHEIHFPDSLEQALRARRRFVYEEFLILQLALGVRRRELRDRKKAPPLRVTPLIDARIRRLFPFALTADQEKVIAEIAQDLASDRPMQRLLQADVGAGKTAVAAYALLAAVANKYQAILMAPTEVLAQQHWQTFETYLAQSRVRRLLLTGALTRGQRRQALQQIGAGEVDLVVGTQALVQNDVRFARLGLVVIDEQHKFGVHQRARVRRLGVDPHYLVMTATPIPRTMALTVFGDLDVSVMKQLPPGRQPVRTRWVSADQRLRIYERVREELTKGRQGFVVCPLVTESESLDARAAEQTFAELQTGPLSSLRLGLLHGRLDDQAKSAVMSQFRRRELDLLVCTSVVEVGVDVPNATLLVVEQADRFGLSQLHQMRGRISRGSMAGECYLFADPGSEDSKERLRAVVRSTDGFVLAEEDARLRGVGQFFGTRQHGLGELRLGDLIADAAILRSARKDAFEIVAQDARLALPEHGPLRRAVLARYGKTLDLAEIG